MPAIEYFYHSKWKLTNIYNHYVITIEEILKEETTTSKEIDVKLFRRLVRRHIDTITVKDVIAENREAVIYDNPQGTDLPVFSIYFEDHELIDRVRVHDFLISLWREMGWFRTKKQGELFE